MNGTFWLRVGAFWGFLGVALGAFGAHGLKDRLAALETTANFHTASQYHFYHALAIVAVGILALSGRSGSALQAAGWSFLVGSLVFSGSLYILAVSGIRWLGAITPIGGVGLLIGWLALAVAAGSSQK